MNHQTSTNAPTSLPFYPFPASGRFQNSDRVAELQAFLTLHTQTIVKEMKKDPAFCAAFSEC